MSKKYIVISSLVACLILYYFEQVMLTSYLIKTSVKVLLFLSIPLIYNVLIKNVPFNSFISYKKSDKMHLKMGLLFGVASFLIILITYGIIGNAINMKTIFNELQNKSKITPANFIFVGLYITLCNSFIEEFFFRGFVFLNLCKLNVKRSAYIYSSVLFGLYHIAIFKTWFNIWLIVLALIGLISVGFIFDWIDTKSQNFINSWIVHILADSAIILIGLRMFGLI